MVRATGARFETGRHWRRLRLPGAGVHRMLTMTDHQATPRTPAPASGGHLIPAHAFTSTQPTRKRRVNGYPISPSLQTNSADKSTTPDGSEGPGSQGSRAHTVATLPTTTDREPSSDASHRALLSPEQPRPADSASGVGAAPTPPATVWPRRAGTTKVTGRVRQRSRSAAARACTWGLAWSPSSHAVGGMAAAHAQDHQPGAGSCSAGSNRKRRGIQLPVDSCRWSSLAAATDRLQGAAQTERSANCAQLAGDCRASKRSDRAAVDPKEHHVEVDAAGALLQVILSRTRRLRRSVRHSEVRQFGRVGARLDRLPVERMGR